MSKILNLIEISNVPKNNHIWKVSNPLEVKQKSIKYFGKNIPIYLSNKKDKKYMIQSPDGKMINFGSLYYEDYTKHLDKNRRINYLRRSENIKGNWKDNQYSPNNLSRNLLW